MFTRIERLLGFLVCRVDLYWQRVVAKLNLILTLYYTIAQHYTRQHCVLPNICAMQSLGPKHRTCLIVHPGSQCSRIQWRVHQAQVWRSTRSFQTVQATCRNSCNTQDCDLWSPMFMKVTVATAKLVLRWRNSKCFVLTTALNNCPTTSCKTTPKCHKSWTDELTVAWTPQQNGFAERMNRTFLDLVRSTLHHKGTDIWFWAKALATAVYARNRVTSRVFPDNVTPYHIKHDNIRIRLLVCNFQAEGEEARCASEKNINNGLFDSQQRILGLQSGIQIRGVCCFTTCEA